MTDPATPIQLFPTLIQQAPALAATLVIVWAFLKHMASESAGYLESQHIRDQLFTAALSDIRTDIRMVASETRAADLAVSTTAGELAARVADLNALAVRIQASAETLETQS